MLKLRPYQREAIDALNDYLCHHKDNPCVVIPTGGGKSLIMAEAIKEWSSDYPPFRCIVLAHRQELVRQNAAEFLGLSPWADVGVYSSGLKKRDTKNHIIFAGIDSVYNKSVDFPKFDVIVVDEAHRIPVRGEGKYRKFIDEQTRQNPNIRVVGFTATPFRLGSGPICHPKYILNSICYEANVGDLISKGYLCRLRAKCGAGAPDLSGIKKTGGDYNKKQLADRVGTGDVVSRAVTDALIHIKEEGRRSIVWFCVDIAHCEKVTELLRNAGVPVGMVTGKTSAEERERITHKFEKREICNLVNCNVFCEGFNVRHVDCIVLFRPTLSKGLYAQMVGRGLRLHPDKTDCLVLDYARCIETHGPIDCLEAGEVKMVACPECREYFPRQLRTCPSCGWTIPKEVIEREQAIERERKEIEEKAAQAEILASLPTEYPVDDIKVARHCKAGSPDSLRVDYRSGLRVFHEWICLDHKGFPAQKARLWWSLRFGSESAETITVDKALQNLFLESELKMRTKSITVKKDGKYWKILDVNLVSIPDRKTV